MFGVTVIDSENGDVGESLHYYTLAEHGNGYFIIMRRERRGNLRQVGREEHFIPTL